VPELIEVEQYRRQAEAVVGRTIADVPVIDPVGLRNLDPDAARAVVRGSCVTGADRIGKLLLLETDGPVLGLRFGMTGRLLVDGEASIERLEYGGAGDEARWDRLVVVFTDGRELRVRDPRRLGGLQLDPDTSHLGPEASTLTAGQLERALAGSRTSLKARLLDQRRVAGLGNLLVDEILWRAGLDPARAAASLDRPAVEDLAGMVVATVSDLSSRGGSHTGDLHPSRAPGATCPRDGAPLDRRRVGGRTTYSCPVHQR
jgi:formamidopyrimidine-DNA glycosylase